MNDRCHSKPKYSCDKATFYYAQQDLPSCIGGQCTLA